LKINHVIVQINLVSTMKIALALVWKYILQGK
jgi:hypothetical protein